jgi:uncharacterized membrane protein
MFEPEVPGLYYIFATFEGTNSYYGSTTSTYIGVEETAPTTPIEPDGPETPTEPEEPSEPETPTEPEEPTEPEQPAEAPLITTEIAILIGIVIIAIIGVGTFWFIRKRQ